MGKSILSVYLDDNIKTLIYKDVDKRNSEDIQNRFKVSNIIEDIIIKYYLDKQKSKTNIS